MRCAVWFKVVHRCRPPPPMSLKIPVARAANGRFLLVEDATKEDGPFCCAECDVVCVLKNGKIMRKHFAHAASTGASGGGCSETAAHLSCKLFIQRHWDELTITLPSCCGPRERSKLGEFFPSATHNIVVEHRWVAPDGATYIMDVAALDACSGEMKAVVEVYHTHETGPKKFAALDGACGQLNVFEVGTFDYMNPPPTHCDCRKDRAILDCKDCQYEKWRKSRRPCCWCKEWAFKKDMIDMRYNRWTCSRACAGHQQNKWDREAEEAWQRQREKEKKEEEERLRKEREERLRREAENQRREKEDRERLEREKKQQKKREEQEAKRQEEIAAERRRRAAERAKSARRDMETLVSEAATVLPPDATVCSCGAPTKRDFLGSWCGACSMKSRPWHLLPCAACKRQCFRPIGVDSWTCFTCLVGCPDRVAELLVDSVCAGCDQPDELRSISSSLIGKCSISLCKCPK